MSFKQPSEGGIKEPTRDRYGRPLIIPPEGGGAVPYTRISTVSKVLDNTDGLTDWKERMVAYGMAIRPDLVARASALDPLSELDSDKRGLRSIYKQAEDAASAGSAANMGNALHSWTERLDAGEDLGRLPPALVGDVSAYRAAVTEVGVTPLRAEAFVVVDQLRCAGSFDRLWRLQDGRMVIGDLKSGKDAPKYSLATAIQMAMYANGLLYDVDARTRTAMNIDTTFGLLIHLPVGKSTCTIYTLDLAAGWEAAAVAAWVHGTWQKKKLATQWHSVKV